MKKTLCLGLGFLLGCCALAQSPEEKPYNRQLEQAEDQARAGNLDGAMETLDGIIAKYPDAAEPHYTKALVFAQVGGYDMSIESTESALERNPRNPVYLNYLIELHKATGNVPAVLETIDRALALYPDNPALFREKTVMLHANKQSEEALETYDRAVRKFGPSDTLAVIKTDILLSLGRKSEAERLLLPLANENAKIRQVYSSLGYIYVQDKKHKQAVQILEKGLANSRDEYLYIDLAETYMAAKKNGPALEALTKAFNSTSISFADKHRAIFSALDGETMSSFQIQKLSEILVLKHPRVAESHVVKGDAMWHRGHLQEARSSYLTAVGLLPTHTDAWRKLVNLELAMDEPEAAIRHGLEALNANPNNALILYFTGLAYLAKDDTESARKMMEAALDTGAEENPRLQSFIYGGLGDLYHKLAMHDVSDAAYEEAVKLDSTNATAMNNYAYYLAERNEKLDVAVKHADRANALEPKSSTFQDTYAWVLFKQGDYPGALRWMKRAMAGAKPSAVLHDHYGDILFKAGRVKAAVRQWEKALAMAEGSGLDANKLQLKIRTKNDVE